jgi:hypothetical protein
MTYRPVDKPAEMPALKLPRRALLPCFYRAVFNIPAGLMRTFSGGFLCQEKQHLPFDMDRNLSPALLKALYSLEGCTEQLGHLTLRLSEYASDIRELPCVH